MVYVFSDVHFIIEFLRIRYAALLIAMMVLYGVAIIGYIFLFVKFTTVRNDSSFHAC